MISRAASVLLLALPVCGQTPQLSPGQVIEQASPSVALVLSGRTPNEASSAIGSAVVVRENGVLLTAYHLVRDAYAVQVRFKDGETFDAVQLLGVDPRRDVAAIKIAATKLPAMAIAGAAQVKAGDPIVVVSQAAGLPWSASTGIVAAYRLADEVSGAGTGYRLLQFTAPISPGSSGGVLIDIYGRALGLVTGSVTSGQNLNFAVPIENVLGLAEAPAIKTFANGSALTSPVLAARTAAPAAVSDAASPHATPDTPEKSDVFNPSRDRNFLLRNFKTMFVDAHGALYFASDQMKAALARTKGFAELNIRIVDDPKLADTVLVVGYTFAWEYPFELKHQNTTTVLLAGKRSGPFSGPVGAASTAQEFVKLAIPFRSPKTEPKK